MTTIENTFKTVDSLISDWNQIVYLYTLVHDLSEYLIKGMYKHIMHNIQNCKSIGII